MSFNCSDSEDDRVSLAKLDRLIQMEQNLRREKSNLKSKASSGSGQEQETNNLDASTYFSPQEKDAILNLILNEKSKDDSDNKKIDFHNEL